METTMGKIVASAASGQVPVPSFSELVEFLRRPESYPDHPATVEVVETHISVVFLTEHYAFKLKKPVHYDFVDFSTIQARRTACEQEVTLNRRLATDVYLGVVPITQDEHARLRLGPGRSIVDWLVKMRRLPAEHMLDRLIETDHLRDADTARVAALLADFYRRLPPVTEVPEVYRRRIEDHVRENRVELLSADHQLAATVIKRVHAAQLQFLMLEHHWLDDRVRDGRIVDGHGDLRPEHICVESPPAIFDCIEFDSKLREVDVIDELSFLVMECDMLGAPTVGRRVLDVYCRSSGDHPSQQLLSFYQIYRACVRAKVAALRARQLDPAGRSKSLALAARYLNLADGYRAPFNRPLLFVVRGLAGTGKSTLAEALSGALGAEWLGTDRVRRDLFGPSEQPPAYGEGHYRPEMRETVYRELHSRAGDILKNGLSVVLDGTFLSNTWQAEASKLASRHGALFLLVNCRCPTETAVERIQQRWLAQPHPLSEARPELHDLQRDEDEPTPVGLPAIEVDTTESLTGQLEAIFERLRNVRSGAPWVIQ
jgi:aminoglycoside phosphotransferase family enzyme/predicted kinase